MIVSVFAVIGIHDLNQIQYFIRITNFVIVPGNEFDKFVCQSNAGLSIKNGSERAAEEVRRYKRFIGITEDTFEFAFCCFLNGSADFVIRCRFLQVDRKVYDETSRVGTRMDMPVSLPSSSGMTLPTALAAPVVEGMIFPVAARPPRQSLADGPSTGSCVAVTE